MCLTVRFDWDEEKNQINQSRHDSLDFETASKVFDDPDMLLRKDRRPAGRKP